MESTAEEAGPWKPAAEPTPGKPRISFMEALASPCSDCDAYCCCYLPLQVVPARSLMEIDFIRYALNFPRVEAGLTIGGQWSLYYVMPCRLFDRHTRSCTVHGTELQPKTCSAYNEHDCWYQRATRDDAAGFLRFDRARFTRLLDVLTFDQDRNLATAPNWGEMVEMCRATPLACTWESVLASEGEMLPQTLPLQQAAPSETRTLAEWLKDPCTRCDAPCCRYLLFPLPIPRTFMQLDYVRFCLGFPGIEVLATPAAWSLLLRADCTHLDAKSLRCTVFDRPERPLHCRHLNQWQCDPYRQLLQTGAPLQRLDYGAFVEISAQARFDDSGTIVEWPGLPAGD